MKIVQLELMPTERNELARCESVIERGLRTFVDVGTALMAIRDGRLYREQYGTFEAYCRERWGWTRQHSNRMIAAAEVASNLEPMGSIPTIERQARPLANLEPEQQHEAWAMTVERAEAEGYSITARRVQEAVDEVVKRPHVAHNSGNNEWYTPPEYIAAARRVMGGIDCDPASSDKANEIVQATIYYTAQDDGLSHEWHGRVWMNPPYSHPLINAFCEALTIEFFHERTTEACVLVNNATDTDWFHTLLLYASCICLIKGRVRFIDEEGNPSGAPLQGQTVLYLGAHDGKFAKEFRQFGPILHAR